MHKQGFKKWGLVIFFGLSIGLVLYLTNSSTGNEKVKESLETHADLKKLLTEGALIVDVRTASEYSDGHVEKSINIPLDEIDLNIEKLKSKNQAIIFCCASGRRSGRATEIVKGKGVECYNGGSWTDLKRDE